MKTKNIFKILAPVLFIFILLSGCSAADSKPPSELIKGNWEYRNQVWCEFKDDGDCIIGGTAGKYEVNDDNSITLSVYTSGDAMKFEWAGSAENADTTHWFVDESKLYINGMQYPRSADEDITENASSDADEKSSASDTAASK